MSKTAVLLSERAGGTLEEELCRLQDDGQVPECSLDLPTGYLSVSQATMYMRCPLQYYWRYVKGVIVPPAARMAEGRAVHKALETGHKEQKQSGEAPPLDIFLDSYRDAWVDAKDTIEDWGDENEKDIMHRDVVLLTEYRMTHVPKMRPVRVESRFWASFGEANIPVVGFVDLINHSEEDKSDTVIDHKVVGRAKSQNDVNSDLQLTVYSHVHATPGVQFTSFVKTRKPKVSIVRATRMPQDGLWAEKVFDAVARGISAGYFPPCDPASWNCTERWCGFAKLCRYATK